MFGLRVVSLELICNNGRVGTSNEECRGCQV